MGICEIIAETHDDVDDICTEYYNAYRRVAFVTPGTYLSFINAFKTVYLEKRVQLDTRKNKLEQGLAKLAEAKSTVAVLQIELKVSEVKLDEQKVESKKVLEKVTQKAGEAAGEKGRVGK